MTLRDKHPPTWSHYARDLTPDAPKPKRAAGTPKQPKRYRADPTRGLASHGVPKRPALGFVRACITASPAELAAIDRAAARVQMSRSQFLRQAAAHFIARLWPEE